MARFYFTFRDGTFKTGHGNPTTIISNMTTISTMAIETIIFTVAATPSSSQSAYCSPIDSLTCLNFLIANSSHNNNKGATSREGDSNQEDNREGDSNQEDNRYGVGLSLT